MEWLVWSGAIVSLFGLFGLVALIVRLNRARKAQLSDEELRAKVRAAMPLNLAALFVSTLGLMMVITGISLS